MGNLFGGGGGGGGGGQSQPYPVYVQPPAPGTLVQTVLSGNPDGRAKPPPVGETEDERKRRLELQNSILGGGLDASVGSGGATGGPSDGPGGGGSPG